MLTAFRRANFTREGWLGVAGVVLIEFSGLYSLAITTSRSNTVGKSGCVLRCERCEKNLGSQGFYMIASRLCIVFLGYNRLFQPTQGNRWDSVISTRAMRSVFAKRSNGQQPTDSRNQMG